MAKANKTQETARPSKIDSIIEILGWEIQHSQKEINAWADEFKKDPAYKIGWMQGIANEAAKLKVKKDLLRALTGIRDRLPGLSDTEILQRVYLHFLEKVLQSARETHNSTSPYSNAISYELDAELAGLIGPFGYLYKYRPNNEEEK